MRVPRIVKISEDSTGGPALTEGELSVCLSVCVSVYQSVFPSISIISVFLFWPGFQARKEPQSNSVRIQLIISMAILLGGVLVVSAVVALYFWQKRKLMKSAPPRALIMGSIEKSGSSRQPRNEYVFLPQS